MSQFLGISKLKFAFVALFRGPWGSLLCYKWESLHTNAWDMYCTFCTFLVGSHGLTSCEVIFMESSLVILGSFEDGDAHWWRMRISVRTEIQSIESILSQAPQDACQQRDCWWQQVGCPPPMACHYRRQIRPSWLAPPPPPLSPVHYRMKNAMLLLFMAPVGSSFPKENLPIVPAAAVWLSLAAVAFWRARYWTKIHWKASCSW